MWPALLFGSFMSFDTTNFEHIFTPWLVFSVVIMLPVLAFHMPKIASAQLSKWHVVRAYSLVVAPALSKIDIKSSDSSLIRPSDTCLGLTPSSKPWRRSRSAIVSLLVVMCTGIFQSGNLGVRRQALSLPKTHIAKSRNLTP